VSNEYEKGYLDGLKKALSFTDRESEELHSRARGDSIPLAEYRRIMAQAYIADVIDSDIRREIKAMETTS